MDATLATLQKSIDKVGDAWEEYKETNDERIEAIEKGAGTAELEEKLEKIEADVSEYSELKATIKRTLKAQQDRIEELEALRDTPGRTETEKRGEKHTELFETALRGQFADAGVCAEVKAHERVMLEKKDIATTTGAAGGFAVPEQIARDIDKLERSLSPVRDLIKVVTVGTSDYKELVSIGGATGGWVGETDTRTGTATSALRERAPSMGEIYSYPTASEWSLDDMFFNVQNWLTEETAEVFAEMEGTAVISGNGTNKPTGFLNTAPVTTDDGASPLRSAEACQYIPVTASPASTIAPDDLLSLVYKLHTRYRARGTFAMNSATTGVVRKLKDGNNDYLWAPGLAAGEPDRLVGYAHRTWENMPDIAADAHPIAFGDWRRFYLMVDRTGMRITRDEVTAVGFVKFYIRQRRGGKILNNDAVKVIKIAAS